MNPPPPPVWTGPVVLTLCLSVLALVVAGGSVWWQVVSWRRSGPRVEVKTINGIGGPPQGVWFIGIEASNTGRLGTQISSYGFQLSNGMTFQALEDFIGMPIQGASLGPGMTDNALYSVRGLAYGLAQAKDSGKGARPFVNTGHGKILGKPTDLGERVRSLIDH